MYKMNVKAYVIFTIFLVSEVRGACYVMDGCDPPEGIDPLLEDWSPPNETCTNCHCQLHRVNIGTCSEFYYAVKKNTDGHFVEDEEEKEVLKEDAGSVECSTTMSWRYDDETGDFIMPTGLRHTTYFYYDTSTECCSTSSAYGGVPPGCTEIKVDECTSTIVQSDDPSKPCNRPGFYYVG